MSIPKIYIQGTKCETGGVPESWGNHYTATTGIRRDTDGTGLPQSIRFLGLTCDYHCYLNARGVEPKISTGTMT